MFQKSTSVIVASLMLFLGLHAQEFEPYPENPIFNGTQAFNSLAVVTPCVIFEDNQYKMWYGGRSAGYPIQVGYAFSQNGINWTETLGPVLEAGPVHSFDSNGIERFCVVKDGDVYKLWYSGRNAQDQYAIGYATSPDGIAWTRYEGNPIIVTGEAGSWNDSRVRGPSVIVENGVYTMWLHGINAENGGSIGLYTSSDGVNWAEHANNPVFQRTDEFQWESSGVGLHTVVKRSAESYLMIYGGSEEGIVQLGIAASNDGVHWTRLLESPLVENGESGSWDALFVGGPALVPLSPHHYGVWYAANGSGNVWSIGYGDLWLGLPGDINEDSQLSVSDVIVLIAVILGQTEVSPEAEILADLNLDATLSIQDVILLVEAILGDEGTL